MIKILNKIGPKTEPCGTPLDTGSDSEKELLILTICDLFCRKVSNHFSMKPSIQYLRSFNINLLCTTLSNAFAKSIKITSTDSLQFKLFIHKFLQYNN